MAILGAHQSIAGGFDRAVTRAADYGCDCVQLFTRNSNQWHARPISADDAHQFREALAHHHIGYPLAHDSYLINLSSPDNDLWRRSIKAFVLELQRAEILGIPYVVTHPGAHMETGETRGVKRIARALDAVHRETGNIRARCLLETTAGQGSSLGWRFEHLADILAAVKHPDRLGVCFDTCHVFAAGYPLATPEQYASTMDAFDRLIGLDRIKAFHLNDSRRELGSHVDRHAHIGRGCMGIESFRNLLADPRFQQVPMYLETPKEKEDGKDMDAVNLRVLRQLTR
jgi:deoxyribonuclease-4